MKSYILVFWDRADNCEKSSFAMSIESVSKRAAEKEGRRLARFNGWRYIETRLPSE